MGKTKIITESAADISKIDAELYGIEVLPFSILMPDGKEYLEQVNITYDEFYEEMEKFDVPPKTAQVNQFLYEEAIEKYKDEYDNFLIITLSAASSATHENALKAKRTFEGSGLNIEVLDSGTFTGAYGVIVREIAKLNLAGADFDALFNEVSIVLPKIFTPNNNSTTLANPITTYCITFPKNSNAGASAVVITFVVSCIFWANSSF